MWFSDLLSKKKRRKKEILKKNPKKGISFSITILIMNIAMWFAAGLGVLASFNYSEIFHLQEYLVGYLWSFTLFLSLFITNYLGIQKASGDEKSRVWKYVPFIAMFLKFGLIAYAGWSILSNTVNENDLPRYLLGAGLAFAVFVIINLVSDKIHKRN